MGIRMSLILLSSILVAPPAWAELFDIINRTEGSITIVCPDHANATVNSGYKHTISVHHQGHLHCSAYDHHDNKISDISLELNGNDNHLGDWVVSQ